MNPSGKPGIVFIEEPTAEAIATAASRMDPSLGQGLVVLLADHPALDLEAVTDRLRRLERPFLGGLFPGVLWDGELHHHAAVLLSVSFRHPPLLIRDVDKAPIVELLETYAAGTGGSDGATVFLLLDGLASNISRLLSAIYNRFGSGYAYLGAGAGSMTLTPKPCLLTPEGVVENAAILAVWDCPTRIGVRHGWQPVGDLVLCTGAADCLVRELNWHDAYETYRAAIREHSDQVLGKENFFDIAKSYPFGIFREDQEPVVRDPIAVQDDGIRCVGEVPENALLQILHGTPSQLIQAAAEAAQASCREGSEGPYLVVDCVSRSIFLDRRFDRELAAIQRVLSSPNGDPWGGVLSIGEIALDASGVLELYNKTIVVGNLGG